MMGKLKVYADRMSQPSRAVIIFCKVNGVDFEEVEIRIGKRQHQTPQFKEINPMGQVPAILDGRFKLFESHAIMRYLACSFPGIADHWYPADVYARAKINSVLDWHHSNLRHGTVTLIRNGVLAQSLGVRPDPKAAAAGENVLCSSLSQIEHIWLKGNGKFLCGFSQPSIADLSLACEIMQLELLDEEHRERILGSYKKVRRWMKDLKDQTDPYFSEVHQTLEKLRPLIRRNATSTKLSSKL